MIVMQVFHLSCKQVDICTRRITAIIYAMISNNWNGIHHPLFVVKAYWLTSSLITLLENICIETISDLAISVSQDLFEHCGITGVGSALDLVIKAKAKE